MVYFHLNMPFETSNLPGAGHIASMYGRAWDDRAHRRSRRKLSGDEGAGRLSCGYLVIPFFQVLQVNILANAVNILVNSGGCGVNLW